MDQLDHDIVQDLLPLYHDGVCSDKSRAAVKNTCNPVRTAVRHWKRWTLSCPRKKLPLTTRRR